MPPIRKLLIGFRGPRLAIGVGISYPDTAAYLKCFDYVIVRSQADFELAKPYVSDGYLELFPDLTYFMDRKNVLKPKSTPAATPASIIRIGLCIAEPCLATAHSHGAQIMDSIIEVMQRVTSEMRQVHCPTKSIEWILIPFNTNLEQEFECDWGALNRISARLHPSSAETVQYQTLDLETAHDPSKLLDFFTHSLDFVVGMRYHSIMFALVSGTPFVALYSTPKIRNMLKYLSLDGTNSDHQMEYQESGSHLPSGFDQETLVQKIISGLTTQTLGRKRILPHNQTAYAAKIRKLIHSSPQFPPISASAGYHIKFLDIHHLNRLAFGTVRQYLRRHRLEESNIDGILDGDLSLSDVAGGANENVLPETAAEEICTLLLSRLHHGKFIDPAATEGDISEEDRCRMSKVAEIYLDGFGNKIYSTAVPLREQLNWIANNYYRNLHPLCSYTCQE